MMKARTTVLVIAVVAVLSLIALGGVAFASGGMGPGGGPAAWMGWMHRGVTNSTQGTPSVYCPMAGGSNGSGAYAGPGGMMGGYPGSQGSQTTQATPAVGVMRVSIQNFAFQPAVIQVTKGTTVTWTNQDSVPHTVMFSNGMQGTKGSGVLQRGQSFSSTFNTPGTYAYFCGAHPSMTGTVIVTP